MNQKPTGRHWLIKSEEAEYSIANLKRDGKTTWTGVRNYEARNFMRDSMQPGDLAFFYHSNAKPSGIAGLARIVRTGIPDPTQFNKKSDFYDPSSSKADPRWLTIEVEFVERFKAVLPLETLKADRTLASMVLLQKGSRLSVQPVADDPFAHILKLAR